MASSPSPSWVILGSVPRVCAADADLPKGADLSLALPPRAPHAPHHPPASPPIPPTSSSSTPPRATPRPRSRPTTAPPCLTLLTIPLLATASLDGTVALLSPSPLAVIATLRGHTDGVSDLSWSTNSFYLCSASDDRTLCIWDFRPILFGPNPGGQPADPNADRCIRVLSYQVVVRIWDVKSGRCVRAIDAHSEPVTSMHFIRDGSIIVSGSHDGSYKIWEAWTGSCLKMVIDDKKPAVSFSMFSPNGKFILVATLDDSLKEADQEVLVRGA